MSATTTPKVGDTWYRYEQRRYGVTNEWDDVVASYVKLELIVLTVTKVTPKGVWVKQWMTPRFVLTSANKRYAAPTKEEALESLLARKARQIRILESQMKEANDVQRLANAELAKLRPETAPAPGSLDPAVLGFLPADGRVL